MKRFAQCVLAAIVLAWTVVPASAAETSRFMGTANYKEVKGNIYSWSGFPTPCPVPNNALILLEKQGPSEVIVGDTFSYQIQISNRSERDMIQVTMQDALPENFIVDNIEPAPSGTDEQGRNLWNLGTIPAKSAKRITVTGRATQVGCMVTNSLARICYELPLPLAVRVVQCNVELELRLPPTADMCDDIELVMIAVNVGSGCATGTRLRVQLPEGLTTKDGLSIIEVPVGDLPVKAQKAFTAQLRAEFPTSYTVEGCITADRDCYGTDTATVDVVAPDLELTAGAPAEGYINTNVPYQIRVANNGNGPARNVIVTQTLNGKFKVTNISGNGKMGAKDKRIVWNLGTINPGDACNLYVSGCGDVEGMVESIFCVNAQCADAKTARHQLCLSGVAGVLTSVKDNCDPVQVGGTVTYTITASNTGSRNAHNLQYAIRLDEGMEYVSGTGATAVSQKSVNSLVFAPLPVLAKGATATWQVSVRAVSPGDKRFTADLITAELTSPVSKAESTNFYEPIIQMVVAQ